MIFKDLIGIVLVWKSLKVEEVFWKHLILENELILW